MTSKRCTICRQLKPLTAFYTRSGPADTRVARARCRDCELREQKASSNARHIVTPQQKKCSRCGVVKAAAEFYRRQAAPDGLFAECKACNDARTTDYRLLHSDAINARQRQYYHDEATQRPKKRQYAKAHRDVNRKACRKYYEKHKRQKYVSSKRYRQRHPEVARRSCAKWRRNNPEKMRDLYHRYRARKCAAFVEPVSRRKCWERDKGICQICRKPVAFEKMHLDHKIPLARGGQHSYENCQTACARCNCAKGAKLLA